MKRHWTKLLLMLLCAGLLLAVTAPALAQGPFNVRATWQRFQYGTMIWRSDNSTIYVISSSGIALSFAARTYSSLPDNPIYNVPAGYYRPINGFGKVWGNYPLVRALLGNAIGVEFGFGLQVQIVNRSTVLLYNVDPPYVIQINPNGTWTYTSGNPAPPPQPSLAPTLPVPASIDTFTVSRNVVEPNGGFDVFWALRGVDFVILEVFDSSTWGLLAMYDNLPLNGMMPLVMPPEVSQQISVVVTGANRLYSHPRAEYTRVIQSQPIYITRGPQPTPYDGTINVYAAWQYYERGFMFWRSDTGEILAFVNNGQVYSFPLASYGGLPDNPYDVPPGFVRPINGFGRVWGNVAYVRDALGNATSMEQGYTAVLTVLDGGGMRLSQPDGRMLTITAGRWTF